MLDLTLCIDILRTNFSGGAKSFDDVFTTDVVITSTGKDITPDLLKVLNSIPHDSEDILEEVKTELQNGYQVTVNFKASESCASIEFRDERIRTTTMSWKAAARN